MRNDISANTTLVRHNGGIKEYRESRGITRRELIRELGIPYKTLMSWETGYRKAPPYDIRLLKMYIDKMALEKGAAESEEAISHEERLAEGG